MNTAQPARRLAIPAIVIVIVAGWFALTAGSAFADTTRSAVTPAATSEVTFTPQGAMKLTVVAARPASQITMTPEGSMKLTVVAQRTQAARVHTATAREAARS